jgi:hypothetical protein
MSLIDGFLDAIKSKGDIVLVATVFTEDWLQGTIYMHDDRHLILKCSDGLMLIAIDDIHGISWHNQAEIILPEV